MTKWYLLGDIKELIPLRLMISNFSQLFQLIFILFRDINDNNVKSQTVVEGVMLYKQLVLSQKQIYLSKPETL